MDVKKEIQISHTCMKSILISPLKKSGVLLEIVLVSHFGRTLFRTGFPHPSEIIFFFKFSITLFLKPPERIANRADPDQTATFEQSKKGLHWLRSYFHHNLTSIFLKQHMSL